jgi:hypothetical protein
MFIFGMPLLEHGDGECGENWEPWNRYDLFSPAKAGLSTQFGTGLDAQEGQVPLAQRILFSHLQMPGWQSS